MTSHLQQLIVLSIETFIEQFSTSDVTLLPKLDISCLVTLPGTIHFSPHCADIIVAMRSVVDIFGASFRKIIPVEAWLADQVACFPIILNQTTLSLQKNVIEEITIKYLQPCLQAVTLYDPFVALFTGQNDLNVFLACARTFSEFQIEIEKYTTFISNVLDLEENWFFPLFFVECLAVKVYTGVMFLFIRCG